MGTLNINSADYGDLTNSAPRTEATTASYTIETLSTDGSSGFGETTYICDYNKWNGYYKKVGILKSVIDRKAMYAVGKGYKSDEKTRKILDKIRGFGKDTFNSLMFNAVVTYTIGGDFYAEIMKDKAGRLVNLKPLNPGSIRVVADDKGVIIRYEQVDRTKNPIVKFQPKDIFHLCWNRVADEIHGVSTIEKCEEVILKYQEAKNDLKKVFHRYVKPIHVFKLDTDDTTEIAAFKAKADIAVADGENLFIPKDSVEMDRVSIPQYSTLDPLPWIIKLENEFIKAEGVPNVVLGEGEGSTEASSKILYLSFQQMVEWNQLFLEDQIRMQLGLDINFEFPASIEPALINDEKKDKGQIKELNVIPNKDG